MFFEFFTWWYTAGWLDITRRIGGRVVAVWNMFSVSILLHTLFAPWKRIISPPGRSFDQILRGMVDNMFSRAVGFTVRLFVLIGVAILTTFAIIIGFGMVVLWPLLPPAFIFALLKGIVL
jgi:hypothetical protein